MFDLRFLNKAFRGSLTGALYIDVLPLVRGKFKVPNNKLETVAAHLGFHPEGGFHNSLTDCEATAAVYFHLLRTGLQEPVSEYRETAEDLKSRWGGKNTPPSQIVSNGAPADENHPFYGKNIVFTGELSMERDIAMQMAADLGASIKGSVSGKTDFLVVGQQDIMLVGASGTSTKERKAHEINSSGKGNIQIITEQDFINLVNPRVGAGEL